MTDEAALLAAIRAAPDDDAPRLIYADWLDEHGQPERAEFIRVQCELARSESPALRQREAELLADHHDAFAGPLAAPHLRFRFERGWPVAFGHTGLFVDGGAEHLRSRAILRFHPDGWLDRESTSLDPSQIAPSNFSLRLSVSRYRFDTLNQPAHLKFTGNGDRACLDYCGVFDGLSVRFEIYNNVVQHSWEERFIHIPIPGFSSFQET